MDFTIQINTLWVLVGAAFIFFMQAGFAMLETGFTRAKNAGNILMKNLMDFACGAVVFWMIGYGLLYGVSDGGVIGKIDLFVTRNYDTGSLPLWAHVVFNTMFCATAATIVSGAMAERTRFKAYIIYSVIISAIVYPITASWVWGGGWLSELSIGNAEGFIDYAGSALVHMVGGISALVGAKMVGPRLGKYSKEGKPRAIPGHNITLGVLGIFILWFGWFGFNGASSYGMGTVEQAGQVAKAFMNTNISAAASAVVTMIFTWFRYKKPDISMTINGALAGLVVITAGCRCMEPWAACVTGACAGILVVVGIEFVDKVLKIDDPVGAIGVHGICGAFGSIACGLFSKDTGLITTGNAGQLAVQLIGIVAIGAFVAAAMILLFTVLKKTIGLRADAKTELEGLDNHEHGLVSAYADFLPMSTMTGYEEEDIEIGDIPMDEAVPVQLKSEDKITASDVKLTKIEIITKQAKFEALKKIMNEIGVTGMTVTQVLGCGVQKGATEYYRGVPLDMQLLPKIQVEIVVAKVPVEQVIAAAKKVLYTGHIGDGKIFIYDVENVVKVRTGERGYDALQGIDESNWA